jgi:DNA-binding response OmpR family regulator
VIVSRLRRKAELAGLILPIRTVYGSGYLFADQ